MFYPILVKDEVISLPEDEEIKKLYNKDLKQFNDIYLEQLRKKYEDNGYIFILPKDTNDNYGRWRWGLETCMKNINLENLIFKKTSDWKVFEKMRPQLGDIARTTTPKTIFYKPEYDTGSSGKFLKDMFGKEVFENPKSMYFIKDILKICTEKKSYILDFFAGSGTTSHAVLELNKEDNGNRRFIVCTNNENNICENITYPRIKKAIRGYKNLKSNNIKGLNGNLQYFKTDLIPVERIDNISDHQRHELTEKAGQMIAIKENTFEEVETTEWYQIFENKDKSRKTAIYFRENMDEFENLVKKIGKTKTVLYVFSYSRIDKKIFNYLGKNIVLEDIPEPILEIYKEINLTLKDK